MGTPPSVPILSTLAFLAFLALLLAGPSRAPAASSQLWGATGEAWSPAGPLPDFSFAGYRRGEAPLPDRSPDVSVKDFGAAGDGTTDDTAAIQKAIDASPGKVILLPAGKYLISDIILIKTSHTVLQGEGPDKTILLAETPLQKIRPREIFYPDTGGTAYAFSGGFIKIAGSTSYFASSGLPVEPGARRGDTRITLAGDHSFAAGDEIVILIRDRPEQSLLTYLYGGDPGDISQSGDRTFIQHITRVTAVDGATLEIDRPLRTDLRPEWTAEARAFKPKVEEIGIEHLAFEFPNTPYAGHFTEQGYNAIEITGALHSWVRDVRIKNADSGIFLNSSPFSTLTGIVIESERKPDSATKSAGHHAISLTGPDGLCTDFDIRAPFIHDITVSTRSVGCVVSNGKGVDLSLDHHRGAPYENLFSHLDLGSGERIFNSGGSRGIGRHAAAGNTYWNLMSKDNIKIPDGFGPERLNFVGVKMRRSDAEENPEGRWIEVIRPGDLEPADLHAAQLARRLGGSAPATATAPAGELRDWTNPSGTMIRARFGGIDENDVVTLIREDQKTFRVPLEKLSPESQALARSLREK